MPSVTFPKEPLPKTFRNLKSAAEKDVFPEGDAAEAEAALAGEAATGVVVELADTVDVVD